MYPCVRCNGCEEVLGDIWDNFKKDYDNVKDNDYGSVWRKYELHRTCCRDSMLSNFELWKVLIKKIDVST